MTTEFDDVIERAHALGLRDAGDARWAGALDELLPGEAARAAFVAWASHHPRWRFNVADVSDRVCAKATEAAIAILRDIVAELVDDADE